MKSYIEMTSTDKLTLQSTAQGQNDDSGVDYTPILIGFVVGAFVGTGIASLCLNFLSALVVGAFLGIFIAWGVSEFIKASVSPDDTESKSLYFGYF